MGDAFNADAIEAGVHGEDEGEDGEDEPADNSVHEAASSGMILLACCGVPGLHPFSALVISGDWHWQHAARQRKGA